MSHQPKNELDVSHYKKWLDRIQREIENYTREQLKTELYQMVRAINKG